VRDEWIGGSAIDAAKGFQPGPTFGFVCPVLRVGV
jgi:hypothetical protein